MAETAAGTSADPRGSRAALAILLVGAVTIGFAPILVRWSRVDPTATAAWRLLLAGVVLWGGMARKQVNAPRARRRLGGRDCLLLAVPGLFLAGDLGLWHWSLQLTTVANATLFCNCAPIFVALAAWLWLKERLGWMFVPGLLLAMGGTAVMLLLKPQAAASNIRMGDGVALLSAVFYGGYQLSVKRLRERFSALTILSFSAVVGGAVLAVVALLTEKNLIPTTPQGYLVVVALALIIHIGGQGAIAHALGYLPASFASVSLLLQPVVAAAAGWVILNEAMGAWQAAGGVLVLAGIFLARAGSEGAGNKDSRTAGRSSPR